LDSRNCQKPFGGPCDAYPRHLDGVRRHVMDHLAGLDLAAFAEAVGGIAAKDVGPAVHRGSATTAN
jgi:hypothetical protein